MTSLSHITECGVPGIRQVPYGLHACHFYTDARQLAGALVPYFMAGLRANERCVWVTAAPLPAAEALRCLQAAWPDASQALQRGQLSIIDFADWYTDAAGLKGTDVVALWLEQEREALARGYAGLRVTGNVTFLDHRNWPEFMEYENLVSAAIAGRRIVALCSYSLSGSSAQQALEVMRAHHCAFDRADEGWQVLGTQP